MQSRYYNVRVLLQHDIVLVIAENQSVEGLDRDLGSSSGAGVDAGRRNRRRVVNKGRDSLISQGVSPTIPISHLF